MVSLFFLSIKKIMIWIIKKYQKNTSSILSHRCRFTITCSQYSINSIQKFGVFKGIGMTFIRILQCHPFTLQNNEKNSNFFLQSNIFWNIFKMNLQRNFFIMVFLIISFILWQHWETEYHFQNTTKKNIDTHAHIHMPSYTINNTIKNIHSSTYNNNRDNLLTIQTDVLLLKINTHGGDIEEAYLTHYFDNLHSKKPLHLLQTSKNFTYQINSGIIEENVLNTSSFKKQKLVYYEVNKQKKYILQDNDNTLKISLIHQFPNGVTYTKNYIFNRSSYFIQVNYDINNNSTQPLNVTLFGNIIQSASYLQLYNKEDRFPLYSYHGAAYSTDTKNYQKYSFNNIKNANLHINTEKGWIAMLQKYFVTAWLPNSQINNTFYTNYIDKNYFIIGFQSDSIYIPIGQSKELQSSLWIGPKIQQSMKAISPHLNLVTDYGWLWFISQPLFELLRFIYSYVNNWGISIIMITLIIRTIMYPLTKAQYISIAKIRMLHPKLSAIQEKYKHDKYQYHQKTIELYKTEKVNPLGGCLPVLIQMPIFLALYYTLSGSVELRHANFIFWIYDLSAKDPYYILPILMGISMFIIQKMSPTTISDPIQKKIMNIILIVFTIFFLWFPAGLVLYYVASNTITIIQQQIIYRNLKKQGLHKNSNYIKK